MAAPTLKQIRMMHVVNLMSIAYTDGKISEEESNALGDIAEKWELTEEEFNVCVEHWKQTDEKDIPIAVPEDEDEQMAYLKDFTLMMMIDGEIDDNEKQYLANVTAQFGYNPEEAVPTLIDMVYQEYFAENTEEEDDDEEEEESFFPTSDEDKIESAKFDLESKHFEDAFDGLFKLALTNPEAYDYFHILPGIDIRLFRLTEEQLELVQKKAKKYAVAQYVLGRYHQVVRPEEDSLETAVELLKSAADAGIGDAQWALATMYLYGYDGPVDYAHYQELLSQASKNGSAMALRQRLLDLTNGEHGLEAEPKKVISIITDYLESDENNPSKYPYLYAVMGDAYRKVGNKESANECYEKASDLGYFECEADKFLNHIEGPDKDFYRVNFSMLLDFGCDENNPYCFLQRGLERAYHYAKKDDESANITPEQIKEDLEKAYELGNGEAAYHLGKYYYTGECDFEQNVEEAWDWFDRAVERENGDAYAAIVRIIDDGHYPDGDLPDGYREICLLNAARRGSKLALVPLIEANKSGILAPFVDEIEQCYAPMLHQTEGTAKMSMVAVIHPDGTATAYKLEKEEWLKLPHLIGAKRLMPLRVDGLEQIGKQAGLTDHLVAWIDLDAPRKGLLVNPVATKFFDGVIAGDIAIALADKLYDPVPFYGLDEAQEALDALGVTLKETVTDISAVSDAKPAQMDYGKLNPNADKGYLARIEADGKAIIMSSGLQMFALFEEDIYDPARLQKLYSLGQQLGLKGRLTVWTNNAELRKILLFPGTAFPCHNPIGEQFYPGAVVDNFFVAMEDESYRIMLFEDVETLKQVCIAMGVKPEDITVQ